MENHNTFFDVLKVHLQWDDPWRTVVTAVQTIPWEFTWHTWITLPVFSNSVQFLDVHDSFKYCFLWKTRIHRWSFKKKVGERGRRIQNTKWNKNMKRDHQIQNLQQLNKYPLYDDELPECSLNHIQSETTNNCKFYGD